MTSPNIPQRIVLAAGALAALALAFVSRGRFDIKLSAVALATVGFVLALRGLPKLSLAPGGWKRLWIVLSLIYLPVVIGLVWNHYPKTPSEKAQIDATEAAVVAANEPRESFKEILDNLTPPDPKIYATKVREYHLREQRWFVLKAVLLWAVPVAAVYLLGTALRWVYRGFRPARGEG